MRPDLHVSVMDSTGKKVTFCQSVIRELSLQNAFAIQGRAEELGHEAQYREQFDVVVSRAVAPLATLVEYMLPFARMSGIAIAMKGTDAEQELRQAENAIKLLGGGATELKTVSLPAVEDKRALIVIHKTTPSKKQYPRHAGAPRNMPL
jgi:16S rRNA (guanine527-N7)-methyltransferase